jgi:PKD repeat protein
LSSSTKQEQEFALAYAPSVDLMTSRNAWHGAQELVYDSASCEYVSQSAYPFQFKILDYPSTLATSKYGPNKFRNEKIRHVSQSVATRFDDKTRSTYVPRNSTAPDSNQIGFFVDPQDFKNRDMVRFFGNFDFMDAIGNPNNQFSGSYDTLRNFRQTYASAKNENSGSRTLFNELITLYKFYFNRSIFEAIKNLTPARSNVLVGVIVEPTVLERPKYHAKPVYSEANTGSVFYADITASHYYRDPNTKLTRLTESIQYGDFNVDPTYASQFNTASLPNNLTLDINVAYINLPSLNYPVNFLPHGTYISDVPDKFQLGHYGSSELLTTPIVIPPAPVSASFYGSPVNGNSPMLVTFVNTSTGADTFNWEFGDGTSSSVQNPVHTYTTTGSFTVRLSATGSGGTDVYNAANYITTFNTIACVSVSQSFQISTTASYSQSVTLGTDTGVVKLVWANAGVADRLVVNWNGTTVIDTNYVAGTGSAYFNKTSEFPAVASITASTLSTDSQGSYQMQCPATTITCVALSQSYTIANTAIPQTASVVLGTGTGVVELFYSALSAADRFVLTYNSASVIDTGFQSGTGSYIFNKTTAFPVTAQLAIYGGSNGSGGSVRVSCPT